MEKEFSVLCWWDKAGVKHEERFESEQDAVERAGSLVYGPSARLDIIKRITVIDGKGSLIFKEDYSKQRYPLDERRLTLSERIKTYICILFHRRYWERGPGIGGLMERCLKCNRRWTLPYWSR